MSNAAGAKYVYDSTNITDLALVSFTCITTEALCDRYITSYHSVHFRGCPAPYHDIDSDAIRTTENGCDLCVGILFGGTRLQEGFLELTALDLTYASYRQKMTIPGPALFA